MNSVGSGAYRGGEQRKTFDDASRSRHSGQNAITLDEQIRQAKLLHIGNVGAGSFPFGGVVFGIRFDCGLFRFHPFEDGRGVVQLRVQ